ncbi:DivIVA domain-containing protein [Ornithinimicrobium sp. Y1694]|uniref:DivIVA domain-containing protein n=1 Tax=Ornithinimicrobium sp. Y1694 TaxID=3418590 RepID=UPI003CF5B445
MPLSAEDVIRRSFTHTRLTRGYDENQVDAFLEEVVDELRRLNTRIDELQAEVTTLESRSSSELVAERVQREQQQIELVREERRDLVADMAQLQDRYDRTTAAEREAGERLTQAEQYLAQLEQRRTEMDADLAERQERLERVQAEHDETLAAQDRTAGELRTLRAAAEAQIGEGASDLDLTDVGNPQLNDLGFVTAVAQHLHSRHVDAGKVEAERLRSEATQEAQALRSTAAQEVEDLRSRTTEETDGLLERTALQSRQLLETAQGEHDTLIRSGQEERERLDRESADERARLQHSAQEEHDRLIREAEEQRAGILADLQARSELLERRIAELDESQRGYRDRLRDLVRRQLTDLDDEGWSSGR